MGQLLHSLGFGALVFGVFFAVAFLYQLWHLQLQNVGVRHFQAKRYAEAAEVFQRVLKRHPPAGIEADTRRRLADTLDVLGRTEEAAQEREQAGAVAIKGSGGPMALTAQGDLLKRQHRFDEACEMYQRALTKTLALPGGGRAQIMAKLAIVHQEAGRPNETLKWAKASLASSPSKVTQRLMEAMAGVASADQGRLEEAEAHYTRALILAEADGKPEDVAQSLASLADMHRKRGHFLEAISAGCRAVETCDSPFRAGRMVQVESLREMGHFDKARTIVMQMKQGPRHDQPSLERRMQAMCALTLAWIETTADNPEAARMALEEVQEHLKIASNSSVWPPPPSSGEDKLAIYCDSTLMRVYAQLGKSEVAQRLRVSVENRLLRYTNDRAILMGTYGQFARAAYFLGDLAESRTFWHRYLDCKPNPVGLPSAYYWLGEISLRLGETDAACNFFRQAVAPGIDSLDARRAKARLEEMGE